MLVIAVCTAPAAAGILDDVKDKFDLQTVTWTQNAIEVAKKIFVALVGTELAWSLIEIFLGTRELDGFIASITRRLIWVGAAIGVFTVAPGVVNNALYDFGTIGATISGYSFEQSSPDAVLH